MLQVFPFEDKYLLQLERDVLLLSLTKHQRLLAHSFLSGAEGGFHFLQQAPNAFIYYSSGALRFGELEQEFKLDC